MKDNFEKDMEYVISVLREAGYSPYEQLYAYAVTGNANYITRRDDARNKILALDKAQVVEYLRPYG